MTLPYITLSMRAPCRPELLTLPEGEILTNSQVVEDCGNITIRFSSGEFKTAVLIARDQRNDLAVTRANR
jgi:S1-C subfamily serine protease